MTLLTRSTPSDSTARSSAPLHSPLALGALAAVQSVVGGLLCVIGPVVGIWIASTRTGAAWSEAVRIAADAWLLAHHTGIAVTGGFVALVPLGLTLVPAGWCWAAGRRIAIALGVSAPGAAQGRSGLRALLAYTAVYALLAAVVSLLAASPVARPVSGQALLGGAVLAFTVTGAGMLHASRTVSHPHPWGALADRLHVPAVVRRTFPGAGVALGVWLAASSLVVAVGLVLGWDGVMAAHRALDPGPVGWIGLVAAQVLLVPVAVVWAGAWIAGPGFAVGAQTAVTLSGSDLGAVPALPLLAALPPETLPVGVGALLAVPVVAGALGGVLLARRRLEDVPWWRQALVDGGTCGVLAGVGAGLLAWLVSGSAGPGRLAEVGPQAWQVALAVGGEVALGCVLALGLLGVVGSQLSLPGRVGSWLRSRSHSS